MIRSLLDIDFYKFTMGQLIFKLHPKVPVRYAMTNRTANVRLGQVIDLGELREALDEVRHLRFNNSELHYLRGTNEYGERMFCEEYLEFLRNFQLPEYELEKLDDGQLRLEFFGPWAETVYWETIGLSIVNALYARSITSDFTEFGRDVMMSEGRIRLAEKLSFLKDHPEIVFSDFGTRRRFSRDWHDYVVSVLATELSPHSFRGTSNTWLAMKHGLLPMGTSAHEMPMVYSGIYRLQDETMPMFSQKMFLSDWWEEYGEGLSIALPDTYGTDAFLQSVESSGLIQWKGVRHDSGDPDEFASKIVNYYNSLGVDPMTKLIVFSDGLRVETMADLVESWSGKINVTFGWGTNLTNDLGIRPLSLVIKTVEGNGYPLVKLSDNLAKAIGQKEEIERMKCLVGYVNEYNQACTY